MKKCPSCAEEIQDEARICRFCQRDVTTGQTTAPTASVAPLVIAQRAWSPGVAAVLSFFIPGAGQIYQGSIIAGLLWFVMIVIGYLLFIVPGLILHFICIVSAASKTPPMVTSAGTS